MIEGEIAWPKLLEALAHVETVGESGVLTFGDDPRDGGILVENGRICWAAARGMQHRLRDLLTPLAGHERDFEQVWARCRADGTPLGQALVAAGCITPNELEVALRQHSAESLIHLCRDDDREPTWTSRRGLGYSPQFTFRPVDMLLDVVALHVPHLQDAAKGELAALSAPTRRGAAFCFGDAYDLAVPVAVSGDLSVHELWTLGAWAMTLPLATRELGATPSFTLAATAASDTIVVWWRGPILYAVACDRRADVALVTAHHLAGDE